MITLPKYRVRGTGTTTVFLLHGAYGDGRYFSDLADSLATEGFRVIDWDCPGYGASPAVEPANIETFAEAAVMMVRKEATETNIVLGHSMGGLIAPRVANAEPRVTGVILSASSSGFVNRSAEDQQTFLAERLAPIENGMAVKEYAEPLIRHMMAKGAEGPLVDHVFDVVLSMQTETFRTSLTALTQYNGVPALEALSVPVLLIAGGQDPACTVAGMRRIGNLVADNEFHVIEDSGHYAFAENPKAYKAIVLEFLNRRFATDVTTKVRAGLSEES